MDRTHVARWPALRVASWAETRSALHHYLQIIGKVQLALAPFRNHWWHLTLAVTTHGLTTGPMPTATGALEISVDLVDHRVVLSTEDGSSADFTLEAGLSCAAFHKQLLDLLKRAGITVKLSNRPYGLDSPPFPADDRPRPYNIDAIDRFRRALLRAMEAFTEFSGWFNGKTSPVQLHWHGLDLGLVRYSGRHATSPVEDSRIARESSSHEGLAFTFHPGDGNHPDATFAVSTIPATWPSASHQPLTPPEARWTETGTTALLAYDHVQTAGDGHRTLLRFIDDAYHGLARAAGWDVEDFATSAALHADRATGTPPSRRSASSDGRTR